MKRSDVEGRRREHDVPNLLQMTRLVRALRSNLLSIATLESFIQETLARFDSTSPWTSMEEMDGGERLLPGVWILLHLRGQDMERLPFQRLKSHVYFHSLDRHLYLETSLIGDTAKQHPLKEWLAYHIAQKIGANVARVKIKRREIFSHIYVGSDEELPHNSLPRAESANLVPNVLLRRWDFSKTMVQRSPVGRSFVEFDYESSLEWTSLPIEAYIKKMIEHCTKTSQYWKPCDFDVELSE
jgi:hypothetical protein